MRENQEHKNLNFEGDTMLCPICKNYSLVAEEIETGLPSLRCPQCKGRWIASYQYWKWKESSGKNLLNQNFSKEGDLPVNDNTAAKLCPECGHFLRRFPVGKGVSFGLDHCGNCGGMWFDANEWDVLRRQGLHVDVHKIFSEIWQNQVRDDEHNAAMEIFYKEKFGEEGYRKARDIKTWINTHPNKSELRAFLGL